MKGTLAVVTFVALFAAAGARITWAQCSGGGGGGSGVRFIDPGDLVHPLPGDLTGGRSRPTGASTARPGISGDKGTARTGIGAAAAATGSRARSRAVSTGGRRTGSSTFAGERWEVWWDFNKGPFIAEAIRAPVRSTTQVLGVGRSEPTFLPSARVRLGVVENEIVPALIGMSGSDDDFIARWCLIAIGLTLQPESAELGFSTLEKGLRADESPVREMAALSLGALASPKAVPLLQAIALGDPRALKLTGGESVSQRLRAMAAVGLGLIGHPSGVPVLKTIVQSESDTQVELKAAALFALGLFEGQHEDIVPFLLGVMDDRDLARNVRCFAPTSIARLTGSGPLAVPKLLQTLQDPSTDDEMTRSCVIALGKLASLDQTPVIQALRDAAERAGDHQTRYLAYIALGEIGSRDIAGPEGSSPQHAPVLAFLTDEVSRPKRSVCLPWAALALAIDARPHPARQVMAIPLLKQAFAECDNVSYRAAVAIALGIVGGTGAADQLLKSLGEETDDLYRGYLGLALGMMHDTRIAEPMRDLMRKPALDHRPRVNAARALRLVGDAMAMPLLIDEVEKTPSFSEMAIRIVCLGEVGTDDAIAPLKKVLNDTARETMLRGLAAMALARIGEKGTWPLGERLSFGINYRSLTPSLADAIDRL